MATYNNIKKIKIGDNIFNLYDSGNSGGTITSVKTTAGTHSAINVSSGAVSFNVPTKTSHLTNDSGYITNAGVTGVKGNSESSYRTGQVNLTAANIGAVATSGNETVAGNKTFSGTTTLNAASVYPASQNTILTANAGAIIQSPIPKYLWHDIIGFCKATTPTYYTTTNGSTWTEATLEKRLFAHMNNWGNQQVLNSSIQGSRWVWHSGNFAYSNLSWIVLGITYNANIATFDLVLEATADATVASPTWTTLCSITGVKYNSQPIWIKATGPSSTGDLRLTITRTSGDTTTNILPLCAIEFLTTRWGDQGKGSEFEYPYNWDGTPNIYPIQNNVSSLGTSSYKWANVYATTLTGNVTGTATGNLTSVQYDSTNKKITKTINGTTSDVVTVATLKTALGYTASDVGALPSSTTYVSKITTTAGAHSAISNKSGAVSFNVPTTAAHVGIKFGYTTSGNNRAVQQDSSGNLYVTQKDDNTIYYAGTGLALTNSTFTVHKAVLCAGGTEGTGTMALAAGTVTQIPMTRELLNHNVGAYNLAFPEDITLNTDVGAIYVYNPGVYRITGSVFLAANSGNSRVQVFLRLGSLTDSFSSATEIARADSYLASGAVNVTRTIQLDDAYMLVYLGARVNDIAGKVYLGNVATYLEVERLSG